jgi:heme/copper-type cytochrome/quinol oxidase subunit 2
MSRPRRVTVLLLLAAACAAAAVAAAAAPRWRPAAPVATSAQDTTPSQAKSWRITARKYSYSEPRIEVFQDDLVKITLESADIPHSFTIDEPYRIAKRVTPGHPVVFEFRADKVGTFDYYCNLKTDDGCRKMKGQLIVNPR